MIRDFYTEFVAWEVRELLAEVEQVRAALCLARRQHDRTPFTTVNA